MDFVKQILESQGDALVQKLVGQAGFGADQARSFLPAAVQAVVGALKGGGLDLGSLLKGGSLQSLLGAVNLGALASETGVDEAKARSGLEAVAPAVLSQIQGSAGGVEGLLSQLGGDKAGGLAGAARGLAGKLFR